MIDLECLQLPIHLTVYSLHSSVSIFSTISVYLIKDAVSAFEFLMVRLQRVVQ